jgi:methyltransferase (TIGR00027 family)
VRTEGDTWDITTSVGSTALFVAAARALEAQRDEPLAVDPYAEVFCRAAGGEWADVLDGRAPNHRLKTPWGEFFQTFQGARTRYFDNYFRDVADAGVRQIVLLAAGLDSRAYRLPWADNTVVFELDQPKVLEFKREVLARHGNAPTAERREIAVDLREDWPEALRANGFEPDKPSAWIAEGLLIYLQADAQAQLFAGIDSLASPGSYVALEEGEPMDSEAFKAAKQRGEDEGNPWFSLVYNEKTKDAVEWFGERGWDGAVTPLTDYVRNLGRAVPDPGDEDAGRMFDSVRLVSAKRG